MTTLPWGAWGGVPSLRRLFGARDSAATPAPHDEAAERERFGDGGGEAPWVIAYVARSVTEAEIVEAHLAAEDIPSYHRTDGTHYELGVLSGRGVKVFVPRTLFDRAREIVEPRSVKSPRQTSPKPSEPS